MKINNIYTNIYRIKRNSSVCNLDFICLFYLNVHFYAKKKKLPAYDTFYENVMLLTRYFFFILYIYHTIYINIKLLCQILLYVFICNILNNNDKLYKISLSSLSYTNIYIFVNDKLDKNQTILIIIRNVNKK